MSFKEYVIKRVMMSFFVSVSCICVVMAVMGLLFDADARFGYEAFLVPLFYGALAAIPTLLGYFITKLNIKQEIIKGIIQWLLIEGIILAAIYFPSKTTEVSVLAALFLAVLIVYLTVTVVLWINDRKTARLFNEELKKIQEMQNESR